MAALIPALHILLLIAALGALRWFLRADLTGWPIFFPLVDRDWRTGRFLLWAIKAWLGFALPTLIALALLGRLDAMMQMPREFVSAALLVGPVDLRGESDLLALGGGALAGGIVVGTLITVWRKRRGGRGPALGDITTLLPQRAGELPYTALLSVSAGITEELYFRLLLPLLITLVIGDALEAFAMTTLLFGAVHRYQGWAGVVATTLTGALFAGVYLATGQLWLAMVLHTIIDLNALVIRPAMTGILQRR